MQIKCTRYDSVHVTQVLGIFTVELLNIESFILKRLLNMVASLAQSAASLTANPGVESEF